MKKFFIGLGLLIAAILLSIPLLTWGILESLWKAFYKRKIRKGFGIVGNLLKTIAIFLDMLGNVLMKHAFNRIFITKDGYQFGEYDKTISYVIGKNKLNSTLSKQGIILDNILEKFEKNHSILAVGNNCSCED